MALHARSSVSREPRVPLTVCVALLLMAVVLAVGGGLGVHNYLLTSRIVLDSADAVFQRMGREVALELARTTAPAELLVDVVAKQKINEAMRLDERMRELPAFAEALRENAAISALYIGYDNGDFFLVRALRDRETREVLGAPAEAAFAVQSIEATQAQTSPSTKFVFVGDDLAILATVDRRDFAFDPRTRGWYQAAIAADRAVRTSPYVFYTTHEPGITFARRSPSSKSVVGTDITLARLSQLLRKQAVAPSSELFLATGEGSVVADNGPDSSAVPPSANDSSGLAALARMPRATSVELARRIASDATGQPFDFVVDDRPWVGRVERLDGGDATRFYLAIAAPRDELLVGVRQMHERSIVVTLAAIVLAIPLAWFVASHVSGPLQRLAGDARAIQSLDFSPAPPVRSIVREIDNLDSALRSSRESLHRFVDISDALAAERDMGRLIERVLLETMQLAGADGAALHLVHHKRRVLDAAQAVRANGAAAMQPASLPLNDDRDAASPIVRAARDAVTILADLPADDATISQWLDADVGADTTLSMLATPLRNRAGEVIGVLSLVSGRVRAAAVRPQVVAFIEKLSGVAAIAIETQRLLAEQKALLDAFIQIVAAAIDAKSPYTGGHCQRVPALAKMLAQAACDAREGPFRDFRLSDDEREALHIASWLHDCGKVTTPEYVVDKATKLSTIYDRIHEVRTRFEVLKRDAEIAFWKDRLADGDEGTLALRLAAQLRALDEDFAFIASCNVGSEAMDDAAIERIHHIAQRTWQRTLDDRIGISWEELARKERRPAQALPATESLLSDAPEHLIERQSGDLMPDDNRWGFRLTVPHHRYNLGEVHNLTVRRGTLTAEERYKINEHIVQTIVMLENLPFPRHLADVPEIAGGHHETMDGRGYPRRLVGGQMCTLARMMAIADIFEALTAVDRPYKKGKALSESLRIMARMRDERHIDGNLFDLFLTSGVYRRYAETYLDKNQMDDVDVEALRGDDAPLRDRPVPA